MAELGANERGQIVSADTPELHDFAHRIGLRRSWFQGDRFHPHYDVFGSRPDAALKAGAITVNVAALRDCMALARREARMVTIMEVFGV